MRSVGIDIGRFSIKVVELTAAKGTYHFSGAKIYPLNQNVVDHEVDIMQTLKTISQDFNTDSAKVVTSIRQNYVSMHKVFFPFRERQKILKSLAFEIEDELPFSIDKCICDSKILSLIDKSAEVLAIACPKDEIEKTLDMFERAGIDPDILSPEYSALANLYQPSWYAPPVDQSKEVISSDAQEDRMIVHFGHERTIIGLVRGHKLYYARAILWGASDIAAAISRTFQVPMSESIKMMPSKAFLLMTSGDATDEQKKMSETVATALDPLIQALRLTAMVAKTEYETEISQIELAGGVSEIKNLGPYLTQALELPTNLINPLDIFDRTKVKNLLAHKQQCAIAFGLAIEGLKRPVNPAVNFRLEEFAKKNQSFDKAWDKWGYTVKALAIIWMLYLIAGMVREQIAVDLEGKSTEVLNLQAKKLASITNPTQSKIKKYIKEQRKKAELLANYEKLDDLISPIQILHEVSNLLPKNDVGTKYDVRHLSVNNDLLTIHGAADDKSVVGKIERALESMATDHKVMNTPPIIPDEPGRTKFSFRIKIKRKN